MFLVTEIISPSARTNGSLEREERGAVFALADAAPSESSLEYPTRLRGEIEARKQKPTGERRYALAGCESVRGTLAAERTRVLSSLINSRAGERNARREDASEDRRDSPRASENGEEDREREKDREGEGA